MEDTNQKKIHSKTFLAKLFVFVGSLFLFGCPKNSSNSSGNSLFPTCRETANQSDSQQSLILKRMCGGITGSRSYEQQPDLNAINNGGVLAAPTRHNSEDCHNCDGEVMDTTRSRPRPTYEETPVLQQMDENEKKMREAYLNAGGNPKAFEHMMCFFKANHNTNFRRNGGGRIKMDRCKIAIQDFTKPSNEPRLYFLNRCTGKLDPDPSDGGVNPVQSSNGSGKCTKRDSKNRCISREVGKGVLTKASNSDGSKLTPSGFHIMGHARAPGGGQAWTEGMEMHGLEMGVNDQTNARGVVFHYVPKPHKFSCRDGQPCYRTNGCSAVDKRYWPQTKSFLEGDASGGPLIYNFTYKEDEQPSNYCGSNLWK